MFFTEEKKMQKRYTMLKKALFLIFCLCMVNTIGAAKIEKSTLEIGGSLAGTYRYDKYSKNYTGYISPNIAYYFANHWFLEGGIGLQYNYSNSMVYATDSVFYISPAAGIGYYTSISERVTFAIPIFFNTYYYTGVFNGRSVDGFGDSVNYGLRPTFKFQIGENVILSAFVSMQAMLVNLNQNMTPSYIFYGISWSYIW